MKEMSLVEIVNHESYFRELLTNMMLENPNRNMANLADEIGIRPLTLSRFLYKGIPARPKTLICLYNYFREIDGK